MALVRIQIDGPVARVYSPFDADRLKIVKSCPGRRWNDKGKFWEIPTEFLNELVTELQRFGDLVQVQGNSGSASAGGAWEAERQRLETAMAALERDKRLLQQQLIRLKNEGAAGHRSWAEALLAAGSPELSERVFKALTRILHPDAGGDETLMTQLNVARDLINGRSQ